MRVAVLACISLLGAEAFPLSAYSAVPVSNEASNIESRWGPMTSSTRPS
jgi:hypothetical protein